MGGKIFGQRREPPPGHRWNRVIQANRAIPAGDQKAQKHSQCGGQVLRLFLARLLYLLKQEMPQSLGCKGTRVGSKILQQCRNGPAITGERAAHRSTLRSHPFGELCPDTLGRGWCCRRWRQSANNARFFEESDEYASALAEMLIGTVERARWFPVAEMNVQSIQCGLI